MADFPLPEDEAALYVVGELDPAERADFEARLTQSHELRALVRELQDGAVALAMAAPRHQPPPRLWHGIKKTVAHESAHTTIIRAFWRQWWLNGWSAAAACALGWLIYAFWANRPAGSDVSTPSVASELHSQPGPAPAESPRTEQTSLTTPPSPIETNTTYQLLQAGMRENEALRQVLELKIQVSHLSESLAQQQALLMDPNRLEFFQLRPASDASEGLAPVPLSPTLQRAISLAMARELGWRPSDSAGDLDVDFVDLRSSANGTTNSVQAKPRDGKAMAAAASTEPTAKNPATGIGTIPAFVSGNGIVVAIDSNIAPSGSHLTFSTAADNDDRPTVVSADLGDNPLVATLDGISTNAGSFTITATTPTGHSHVFHAPIHGRPHTPRDRGP